MQAKVDLTKEYGLILDGGGARGAYQLGAWKALGEAGVKVPAVAGTSVGALNGALIRMGDVKQAEKIWSEMTFSRVMDVDDAWMERLFNKENTLGEVISEMKKRLSDGGIDITPLKNLIHEMVDEKKIRESGMEFCLLTFSISDMKELDLSIHDLPERLLEDFLLARAYLIGIKNDKLHGRTYVDGGVINNVPTGSLVKRGYKNLIQIRIYGPGREPRVKLSEDTTMYEIAPRVKLGSIIEFYGKRSRQNLKIGYYDAKRMIYGLAGTIYYIEQTRKEWYYEKILSGLSEIEKAEIAFVLKLSHGFSDETLYMAMLEASAKLLHVPKYQIYTVQALEEAVYRRYERLRDQINLPRFVHVFMEIRKDSKMNLKGRNFLTLKDFTPDEIMYLVDLAADLKEKKKQGITGNSLKGKNIALIFEKPSTRTRCAFTVGACDEGGIPTYLSEHDIQLGHKESIQDTARVLGRMFDGIEFRGFKHEHVEELKPPRASKALNEHWDLAVLSKTLATIEVHADVEYDFEEAKLGNLYTEEAYAYFQRLQFKNLLSRFDVQTEAPSIEETFCAIETKKEAETYLKKLEEAKVVGAAVTKIQKIYCHYLPCRQLLEELHSVHHRKRQR